MTFKVKVWPLDKPYHRPAKFKRTHTPKKCLEELCIIELGEREGRVKAFNLETAHHNNGLRDNKLDNALLHEIEKLINKERES